MTSAMLPPARLAWTIWGLGAALYIIGFFQRVAPGVMTAELTNEFSLTAAALGNLSAFYFYSYVAMQIPTGLLADSWGPRRLLTAGAAVAGVGSLCFALADGMFLACAGRLLVGGSVAVAFVAMMKLSSHWMAPRQFALASGMALFLGILGAVFAGTPLRLLVTAYGWRPVMLAASALPFAVAAAIWLIVRDDPQERGYASYAPKVHAETPRTGIIAGLREVFAYRNTWLLLVTPGAVAGSTLAFAGLWGVPLSDHPLRPERPTGRGRLLVPVARLGRGRPGLWRPLGPDRPAQAALRSWLRYIGDRLGRHHPRAGSAAVTADRPPHHGRLRRRLHDHRLRFRQGIGAVAARRDGSGSLQHGLNDGPDAAAACRRLDARPPVGWDDGGWSQSIRTGGLPRRIFPDAGLDRARPGLHRLHPGDPLPAKGLKQLKNLVWYERRDSGKVVGDFVVTDEK
jgi:MFS family permease